MAIAGGGGSQREASERQRRAAGGLSREALLAVMCARNADDVPIMLRYLACREPMLRRIWDMVSRRRSRLQRQPRARSAHALPPSQPATPGPVNAGPPSPLQAFKDTIPYEGPHMAAMQLLDVLGYSPAQAEEMVAGW